MFDSTVQYTSVIWKICMYMSFWLLLRQYLFLIILFECFLKYSEDKNKYLLLVVVGDLWLTPLDAEVAAGQVGVGVAEGVLHEAEQTPAIHTRAPRRV